MTGQIKRIKQDKGFGFIRDESGQEYFFHHSALLDTDFTSLREGDRVEFQPTSSNKGLRAENVQLLT